MRVSASWLALREPADARARAAELVERLALRAPLVVHDLGAGTGSMGRWLAPRLPAPQHWVLHDNDADLLALAAIDVPEATLETRLTDITRLRPSDLARASLITASALLDLLTAGELTALVDVCVDAACPVLLTLSVVGRVELDPPDPFDARVAAAFDAHQRRENERSDLSFSLLGPDAVAKASAAFRSKGFEVSERPSPWRLGAADSHLIAEWLIGWVGAACEQQPDLEAEAAAYVVKRLEQIATKRLRVTVGHADLLAQPSKRADSA